MGSGGFGAAATQGGGFGGMASQGGGFGAATAQSSGFAAFGSQGFGQAGKSFFVIPENLNCETLLYKNIRLKNQVNDSYLK